MHAYTHTRTHTHTHVQVRHRYTEQVMVMKEMRRASKEAKLSFLKEVCSQLPSLTCAYLINLHIYISTTGTTAQKPQSHEYLTIYWHFIQRRQSAHSHHRYVSCNHLYTYTHIIIMYVYVYIFQSVLPFL